MSDDSQTASSAPRARWRLSRRGWILVGLVLVVIGLRAALPTILQKVIVSQGNEYLAGSVEVGDVDLWLLSGAVALKDVSLRPAGEASDEEGVASGEPPLVSWSRLYVDIGWMPLLDRIANIQDLELDGLRVNVARLHDGTLVLPELQDLPPTDDEDEPEGDESEPFGILVDRAAILNTRLHVRDDVPDEPTSRELKLPSIEVADVAINDREAATPGHILIQAGLRDGKIRIDTEFSERPGGFQTETQIDITHLPLDQLHVHEPGLGWTGSEGRLDGSLHVSVDPEARIVVSGDFAVSDLQIEVPNEDEPGLAWRRLSIELEKVAVADQTVDVRRIALDGAGVLVRLTETSPLPILAPVAEDERGDDDARPVEPIDLEREAEPSTEEASAAQADSPADWTIHVAAIEITDSDADLALEQGPASAYIGKLSVRDVAATTTEWTVAAVELADSGAGVVLKTGPVQLKIPELTATGLTSDPSSPIHVVAKLEEDASVIDVDATVVQSPLTAQAKLELQDLFLGRYADLSGVSPVLLPTGTLQAALAIDVADDAARVSGQIAIDDLKVVTHDGKKEFAIAWETLAVDVRSFDASLTDPEAPMQLELVDLRLVAPKTRTTLTDDGIVLPTVREDEPATSPDAPAAPAAEATPTATPVVEAEAAEAPADEGTDAAPKEAVLQPGLVVQTESVGIEEIAEFAEPAANLPLGFVVDRLRIEDGEFRVTDRAVKPTYRGKITDFDFEITGVELPIGVPPSEAVFEKLAVDLKAPGGAPVKIRAGTEAKGVRVNANVEKLPLSQFNPYVRRAAGYTILEGAATVESTVLWAGERYESDTDLTLGSLDVGSETGGTLFQDYFGISLSAALALLRDVTGDIGLGIPVSGTMTDGTEVGIGSIVGQALTKAILGAILSPLKMLGAVTMIGGKVGEIAPSPVPFRPGSTEFADQAVEQVESLGSVLAAAPAVRLELAGAAGPDDVRALKETAVLADLSGQSGLWGGVRNLASGGARNAIRKALEAGDPSSLDADDAATLDELAAEKEITDEDLTTLANDRANRLRQILVEDDGVPPEQLSVGTPEISREDGVSQVRVNLLARG